MLTYQTNNRIMHYLSYPTAVDVTTKSDDVVLPDLMICSSNTKKMVILWNKTYETLKADASNNLNIRPYLCGNMMKSLMAMSTYGMDELWKATNTNEEVVRVKMKGYSNKTVLQSEIGSVYGICAAFQFHKDSSKSFVGKLLTVNFKKVDDYVCPTAVYNIVLLYLFVMCVDREKLRLTIRQLMKNYANQPICNLTGLDDFVNNRRSCRKRRVFWLLLFLLCTFMLTYQTNNRIMHYLSYPTAVDVTTKSDDVVLPDLMICSSNTKKMVILWNKTYETLKADASNNLNIRPYLCGNMMKSLMAMSTYGMDELWKATNMNEEVVRVKMKGYSNKTVLQSEIGSVYGICAAFQFHKDSSKSFVGKLLTVNFKKVDDYVCPTAVYNIVLLVNDFGKPYFIIHNYLGANPKINLSYKKYLFINLPLCECSNTTHEQYGAANELIDTTDPIAHCSCHRPCEQLMYKPHIEFDKADDKKKLSLTLAITNDKIDVYEERYAYDVIALLSDLGGNLGLFLGQSLLSLPEIIWYLYCVLSNIWRIKPVNKIHHLYGIYKKKMIMRDQLINANGMLKKLKLMLVTISAGLTLYLLQCRLNHYIEEPITKVVSIVQRDNTQFPSITVCGETQNDAMDEAKLHLINQANPTCNNISPWQLFNKNLTELSLKSIWDALNVHETINAEDHLTEITSGYKTPMNITKNLIPLPFGHCSQVHTAKISVLTAKVRITFEFLFPSEVCHQSLWCFVNNPENEVNILAPLTIEYGKINVLTLQILKTKQKNRKLNPCEENKSAYLKLPYISAPNLPVCNTKEDIMSAHLIVEGN
uniref:Uncharacterized protein n=1 Tax=Strigamia maritima TaxID=126957 RepID=T1JEH2_STRMM